MLQEMKFEYIGFLYHAVSEAKGNRMLSTLRVCSRESWRENNEMIEREHWFSALSFAPHISDMIAKGTLKKGRYLRLRGKVQENAWESEGKKISRPQFIIERLEYLDRAHNTDSSMSLADQSENLS
ncbi:hypothetical protein O4H49_20180 [Kiloniella laminariae]|uniref:Single-stranded DNA-binding protein n=1 Tax=Kiloniella laminariae TaxID=454162 RepID=A0ABT4LPQ5_9PROT|nr:hypothetical protein [Kiloniella laminariae]MCZ4283114.1 hypothetical protein [Kiloniella laminariae]